MIRALTSNGVEVREVNGCNEPEDVTDRIDEVLADWGLVAEKQFDKVARTSVSTSQISTSFADALDTALKVVLES